MVRVITGRNGQARLCPRRSLAREQRKSSLIVRLRYLFGHKSSHVLYISGYFESLSLRHSCQFDIFVSDRLGIASAAVQSWRIDIHTSIAQHNGSGFEARGCGSGRKRLCAT